MIVKINNSNKTDRVLFDQEALKYLKFPCPSYWMKHEGKVAAEICII